MPQNRDIPIFFLIHIGAGIAGAGETLTFDVILVLIGNGIGEVSLGGSTVVGIVADKAIAVDGVFLDLEDLLDDEVGGAVDVIGILQEFGDKSCDH